MKLAQPHSDQLALVPTVVKLTEEKAVDLRSEQSSWSSIRKQSLQLIMTSSESAESVRLASIQPAVAILDITSFLFFGCLLAAGIRVHACLAILWNAGFWIPCGFGFDFGGSDTLWKHFVSNRSLTLTPCSGLDLPQGSPATLHYLEMTMEALRFFFTQLAVVKARVAFSSERWEKRR